MIAKIVHVRMDLFEHDRFLVNVMFSFCERLSESIIPLGSKADVSVMSSSSISKMSSSFISKMSSETFGWFKFAVLI